MCDKRVQIQILTRLLDGGEVVSETGSDGELQDQLMLRAYSRTVFKRALGCAINRNLINRHRPPNEGRGYEERPVRLRITEAGKRHLASMKPGRNAPYFVSQ